MDTRTQLAASTPKPLADLPFDPIADHGSTNLPADRDAKPLPADLMTPRPERDQEHELRAHRSAPLAADPLEVSRPT